MFIKGQLGALNRFHEAGLRAGGTLLGHQLKEKEEREKEGEGLMNENVR